MLRAQTPRSDEAGKTPRSQLRSFAPLTSASEAAPQFDDAESMEPLVDEREVVLKRETGNDVGVHPLEEGQEAAEQLGLGGGNDRNVVGGPGSDNVSARTPRLSRSRRVAGEGR